MKINYILSIALICLLTVSCSLDRDPLSVYSDLTEGVSKDSVKVEFKNKEAVLSHRKVLHDLLRNGQESWYLDLLLLAETHADNSYAGAPGAETTPFEVNSIEGSNINLERDWNAYMVRIANVNKLIINIDMVADATLTAEERKSFKAEALILRAMIYFDMVRIWGNVPLITTVAGDITSETIEEVYPAYFPPQASEIEVYQQIEKDLLEGIQYAPNNNPSDKTLISKSVARALLAKMYAEKPLRDYDKVIKYADELAAEGFDLVENFSDLFGANLTYPTLPPSESNKAIGAKMQNTKESIYEAQFITGDGNWCTWMFGRPLNDWNNSFTWSKWITPSLNLIKAYQANGEDKRYAETVVFYACGWSIYYPKEHYPFMYKCRSALNSIIKMRYADILLLKAEALIAKNELNGAATIINKIRTRAGLNNLIPSTTANKEALLTAYLNERRLELAFEGHRWFDLVRLDKVEEIMNNINTKDTNRPKLIYPYNQLSYKLPIPQAVIDQNPNLIQNPGY